MNLILHYLNINTVLFTIFNYPMSYIEFFGTIFNLASVYLVVKKHIWNWPIGNIGAILFFALFYQLHLYADQFEQVYYFITGFWGWYLWNMDHKARKTSKKDDLKVERNSLRANVYWIIGIAIFSAIGTWAMSNINHWLPRFFPEAASLPAIDVTTTIMSFSATILMAMRKVECWVLWVAVDVVAVWLYWYKGIPFVSLLYAVFLVLATLGGLNWLKTYRNAQIKDEPKIGPNLIGAKV